jgi:hypothetical protein
MRILTGLCAALLALSLAACAGDPPTSNLSAQQQAIAVCQNRGGISQLSVNDLFAVCRDGTLHTLEETR